MFEYETLSAYVFFVNYLLDASMAKHFIWIFQESRYQSVNPLGIQRRTLNKHWLSVDSVLIQRYMSASDGQGNRDINP